jgi:hypothetical protein
MFQSLFPKTHIPEPYASLLDEIARQGWAGSDRDFKDNSGMQGARKLSLEGQRDFVLWGIEWIKIHPHPKQMRHGYDHNVRVAINSLLKRKLPLREEDLRILSQCALDDFSFRRWAGSNLTKAILLFLGEQPPTEELRKFLYRLVEGFEDGDPDSKKNASQIRSLLDPNQVTFPLDPEKAEVWVDIALAYLAAQPVEQRTAWATLLQLCMQATSSAPSTKWLRSVDAPLTVLGPENFKTALLAWFAGVEKPRTRPVERLNDWESDSEWLIDPTHANILRGLVWLCSQNDDDNLARALTRVTISAYRKIPQVGPRCAKLGNACLWVLGNMPGQNGISQLAVLKARLKLPIVQKIIDNALSAAAERVGLSSSELEELAAPAYGLDEVGLRRETLGDFTAELVVSGPGKIELRWLRADGKSQTTVPQAVKDNFTEEFKEIQQAAKDIQKMLPAQASRIENLYLQQKSWPLATWRERYFDHPLVGVLARRLIWKFSQGDRAASGIGFKGQIIGRDGQALDWLSDATRVELWHPLQAPVEVVLGWREWLTENEIQQPFKQAHREVYLLTDAEVNTETYSNRFAGHIIKQHQFNALCAARSWKNKLRLMVDDSCPPASRLLPEWGLRAEYWIESVGDNFGTDTNAAGTYLYLSTDQVRFYPIDAAQASVHACGGSYSIPYNGVDPLPLEQIPPLVFTEIMRDVDLFVGVASVGNDPNWSDGGPRGQYADYWHNYSFGNLSETAKTRKDVLERLLPRLKIAGRCALRDRFLVVRGDLKTYKIHLGSGNILMEPNDQYLCIVPSRSPAAEKVFLPFEGDTILAVVLSKAFLLAEDKKITDPTILRQIR